MVKIESANLEYLLSQLPEDLGLPFRYGFLVVFTVVSIRKIRKEVERAAEASSESETGELQVLRVPNAW
ncbi:hypothetical protein BJX64DRAFT_247808 [Aspergillus heterothallicus]